MPEKLWDVFVSYKRNPDEELALDLLSALEGAGLKCWIAPRDIRPTSQQMIASGIASDGGWDDAIPYAIERSRTMVIVVSKAAMESKQIQKEIYLGDDTDVQFIPVLTEDVPLQRSFKYHLGRAQWINCFTGEGSQRFLNVASEVAGFLGVASRSSTMCKPDEASEQKSHTESDNFSDSCGRRNPEFAMSCQVGGAQFSESTDRGSETVQPVSIALPRDSDQVRLDFWTQLLDLANQKSPLHAQTKPGSRAYVQRSVAKGYVLRYACNADRSEVGLYIDFSTVPDRKQRNREAFLQLLRDKEAIETKFGGSLEWRDQSDTIAYLICTTIDGGTRSPREEWPAIHAAMADAMLRLQGALPANVMGNKI